jgi:hypothetical protein
MRSLLSEQNMLTIELQKTLLHELRFVFYFTSGLGHTSQGAALQYYVTRTASVLAQLRDAAKSAITAVGYGVELESDSGACPMIHCDLRAVSPSDSTVFVPRRCNA